MDSEQRIDAACDGGRALKELLVFRHAKTERDSVSGRDFDRELASRGLRDAQAAGSWLKEQDCVPDRVVCSTAARARQTAELTCRACGFDQRNIEFEKAIYEAFTGTLFDVVSRHMDCDRMMLVGHNPGFEMLVASLSGRHVTMPTAAIARLEWTEPPTDLTAQKASLAAFWTPKNGDLGL